jgi:hypothetical protein
MAKTNQTQKQNQTQGPSRKNGAQDDTVFFWRAVELALQICSSRD